MDGIENVVAYFDESERERFVRAVVEEMLIRRSDIRAELERALKRAGWKLVETDLIPASEDQEEAQKGLTTPRGVADAAPSNSEMTNIIIPAVAPSLEKEVSIEKKRIFIGHGRSLVWRELKDFLQERLHLPWEEFNREPVAGGIP